MTSTMTQNDISARIRELEDRLANPPQFHTEVYTRIVGYYRSVAAWNKGKREEFNHRKTFDITGNSQQAVPEQKVYASSYLFFFRQTCPACPLMKKKLETIEMSGVSLDTDSDEGLSEAIRREVTSTPTVIFLDATGKELERVIDPRDWDRITSRVVSPV